MSWRKSIPAVLLLTLAAPPAQSRGLEAGPARSISAAPGSTIPAAPGIRQARGRRREQGARRSLPSPETLAFVSAYVRCRLDRRQPDADATAAWQEFYPWCDERIRRFAGAFGARGIDIEDCAQDVWTELMFSLPEFHLDSSRGQFTSWLYSIVQSKAGDLLRRQARRRSTTLTENAAGQLASAEPGPAIAFERKLARESVRQALGRLRRRVSDLSYRVLHLRYVEGLGAGQVAQALGLTRQQVWVREHRMKRKLGELFRFARDSSGRMA